ncbi:MAG: recombinase family protein [Hyphomicrobiales bacterium]|nr:recombinase family protein [Hyphomicrobiales bacterium]
MRTRAFAYLRTSSAANVGLDKDSEKRQLATIEAYAARENVELVSSFYDAAVRGGDAIDARPGFAAMLEAIAVNGVRTIIVESANRFARDLIVQETGHRMLRDMGITLIAADSPDAFIEDSPTTVLIRQVLGAVAQFEKAALVAKLRAARERKRRLTGRKVGGRASIAEMRPEVVEEARRLSRRRPKGGKRSLREIATELANTGHVAPSGKPYHPDMVRRMLAK